MTAPTYRSLLWSLVLFGLLFDQASKYLVFSWLYNAGQGGVHVVVPNCFELLAQFTGETDHGDHPLSFLRTLGGNTLPHVNAGALFGIASSRGGLANGIFAVVSIIAALAIAYWSILPATVHDRTLCVALGLILAGTLGNLFDRIVFSGVRDFIHWFYYQSFDWPVFNIADSCLVCGAALLLVQAFWGRPVQVDEPKQAAVALSATPVKVN